MKEIILTLLIILLFVVACKQDAVDITPYSVSKHIDSSAIDTSYRDTL